MTISPVLRTASAATASMAASSERHIPSRSPVALAVVIAGVVGAAGDLAYALTYCAFNGIGPVRVLQSIASGWLGKNAFAETWPTAWPVALLGLLSHFFIVIVAAFLYFAALRRSALLRKHIVAGGMAYGVAIYAFMHLVVLPLSNAPPFKSSFFPMLGDLMSHIFLLGVPMALLMRRALRPAAQ